MSVETMKQRRFDAGTPVLTDRDLFALTWISHQYAIRLDHLQVLLGQHKGASVSIGATRKKVCRWIEAGWVEARKFLSFEPSWVWPTEEGLSKVDLSYKYKDFNELYTILDLQHLAAVNTLRLHTSEDWTSQRQFFQRQRLQEIEYSYESLHGVDAEVRLPDGEIIAVKVQMRLNPLVDLEKTLIELLRSPYTQVWYFGGEPAIRKEVREMCAHLVQRRDLNAEEVSRLRALWYPRAETSEERQQQELEARILV